MFIKNQKRISSLEPLFVGPYKVIWRRNQNVKLDLGNNESKVVHLNNCKTMTKENNQLVLLPVVTVPHATNEVRKTTPAIQQDIVVPNNFSEDANEDDNFEKQIAYSRPQRNKAYNRYGPDFELNV